MIVGVGLDLIESERLEATIRRFGSRFLERCFTEGEVRRCSTQRDPVPHLAARFAAKEAAAKALGTGLAQGIGWKHIEVVSAPGDPPRLQWHGPALAAAVARGVRRVHLSLTHARRVAVAVVILEGDPLLDL